MSDDTAPTYNRFRLDRPCPKCGAGPTPSTYCEQPYPTGGLHVSSRVMFHAWVPEGGHLHRTCLHCGFERIEIAQDAPLLSERTRAETLAALRVQRTERQARERANMAALFDYRRP